MAQMKENQHVKPIIDVVAGTVTFQTKGMADIVLHADKLHADILKRAALVGMAQVRIVDAAAISSTDKDGRIVPEAERIATKHARMSELVAHYESGTSEWSRVGEGGGGKSITVEAIAELKKVTYDEAEKYVEEFAATGKDGDGKGFADTKAALAFLRTGSRVRAAIDAIRAKRAPAPKVDADKALDDLTK